MDDTPIVESLVSMPFLRAKGLQLCVRCPLGARHQVSMPFLRAKGLQHVWQ